jgi:protein-S-isoprenylcysteine O-methyltransferase Ste14
MESEKAPEFFDVGLQSYGKALLAMYELREMLEAELQNVMLAQPEGSTLKLRASSSDFAAFAIAAHRAVGDAAASRVVVLDGTCRHHRRSVLRRHCWRMLGASFSGAVIVRPDQMVVDRGTYRYVRHPSYAAGTIMFFGIGLALANWINGAALFGAISIVYGYRVDIEERGLVAVIGDPYRRYMSRTKRFVPFLF